MSDAFKQRIDDDAMAALEKQLIAFCDHNLHKPGNPALKIQLEEAQGSVKLAMENSPDGPSAIVGAAMALRDFIRTHRMNKMKFTKPYPKSE